MKAPTLAISATLACLLFTSCQQQRNLAQFGDIRLGNFGNSSETPAASDGFSELAQVSQPGPPSPATGQPAAPAPVISDRDPVVAMARAQAASELTAPMMLPTAASPSTPLPGSGTMNPYTAMAPSASTIESAGDLRQAVPNEFVVKTTAYTHLESDHLQYGKKTAYGDYLKFGAVRSAAADWSRYPVGTRFRIKGMPYEYVVDDYGSALVGTDTIDLYKPDHSRMDQWGARDVGIEVLEWGSFEESKRILESRKHKPEADHVRKMLRSIEEKIERIPAQLRDGFRA